jgi:uncharacterized protein YbjT (DUF2867 family)
MAILVTGSTGRIGSQILQSLSASAVEVRALTRSPEKANLPNGVKAVKGDLADPDSMRKALEGVSTLFLLAANVADEMTQAMQALVVARDSGIKGAVYLSVLKAAEFTDVPHFASKRAVELMIEAFNLPVTILRPAYFIQNDVSQRDPLLKFNAYGMPIGSLGVSMVDTRDIGEAAAIELTRRERAPGPLPRESYALVGPDRLTGASIAEIWSEALGRKIQYGGDDLKVMEERLKSMLPAWHALDLRLMVGRYQSEGAYATTEDIARLTKLLGHAPRSYRDFAHATAKQWTSGAGA